MLDTKVLTSWNALMIRGLAHAGRVLEEPRYVEFVDAREKLEARIGKWPAVVVALVALAAFALGWLLLGTAAMVPLLSRRASAFGEKSRFIPAVVQHGGRWDARLNGLRRIAWELQRRTSVEVLPEARPCMLESSEIFEYPFLYLGGVCVAFLVAGVKDVPGLLLDIDTPETTEPAKRPTAPPEDPRPPAMRFPDAG